MPESDRPSRRRQAREGAKGRGRKRGPILFPVIVGLLVVGGVAAIFMARSNPPAATQPPEGVETFEIASASHVDGRVPYEQEPPVGGPHAAVPLTCGFYSQPVPSENAVHSLEHGAVWVTYDPELPEDDIGTLRGKTGSRMIVSPWPGDLPAPVVASAWGRQLLLEGADDPDLDRFIAAFRTGPTAPEPGAPCAGLGQPA